jgi:biopolymer transport protein ExbD
MGMSVGENKGGAMAEMNVVPLIDILLVLLIIFMVITPLTPKGMDTLVPQPNPNQQQNQDLENKTVVVQIDKNGKVKINNEDATWERLGPRIEEIFKDRAEKVASSRATMPCCLKKWLAPLISCAALESTKSARSPPS